MEDTFSAFLNATIDDNPLKPRNNSNRGPGLRRRPPQQTPDCGTCNDACVYSCVRLLFVVGVLANALMIFRVIRDKKLRSPTFIALASLAVADGLYLLIKLALTVDDIITQMTCGTKMKFTFKHLPGFMAMFWFSASFHVSLLAAMRYVVLVYPLKTLTLLTQKRIIFVSVSIWVVSVVTFGSIMISYEIDGLTRDSEKGTIIRIVTWILAYFTPVVLTAILHIVKLIKVRKFAANLGQTPIRVSDSQIRNKRPANRMIRIIIIIILAGAILPLPAFVLGILKDTCNIYIKNATTRVHFQGLSQFLFLLNFAINPFIYAYNSKTFRSSLRRMTRSSIRPNLGALDQHSKTTPSGSPDIKSKQPRKTREITDKDSDDKD